MPISFTGALFPNEMIRTGVRWYMAAPLSTRNLGEMMLERHFRVDHSTMNRWVIKYSPQLEAKFHINTNHMPSTARPIGKTTIGGRTS